MFRDSLSRSPSAGAAVLLYGATLAFVQSWCGQPQTRAEQWAVMLAEGAMQNQCLSKTLAICTMQQTPAAALFIVLMTARHAKNKSGSLPCLWLVLGARLPYM